MKRLLTAALAACLSLTAGVAAAEPLKLGLAPEAYPPFESKASDGTWKGFEIDLGQALCKEMKRDCTLVEIAWDGIIPALRSGKIDVIFNSMTITDERKKEIDFSVPYYSTNAAFIGPKDTRVELTAEGLKGKVIGAQASTTHSAYVEEKFKDSVELKTYPTQDEANADLVAGRVDLVVADKIALNEFLKSPDVANLGIVAEVPAESGGTALIGAGVRKDDKALKAALDAAIAAVLKDGTYDRLAKPYFSFDIYGLPRN